MNVLKWKLKCSFLQDNSENPISSRRRTRTDPHRRVRREISY